MNYHSHEPWLTYLACILRRTSARPLLPLYYEGTLLPSRRTSYLMELDISQTWIGQHAASWSFGQPRVHRIADT